MKYLTLILTFLMTIGSQVIAEDIDDGSLSNGHLNYVCDGETYIIISTNCVFVFSILFDLDLLCLVTNRAPIKMG